MEINPLAYVLNARPSGVPSTVDAFMVFSLRMCPAFPPAVKVGVLVDPPDRPDHPEEGDRAEGDIETHFDGLIEESEASFADDPLGSDMVQGLQADPDKHEKDVEQQKYRMLGVFPQ